MALLQDGKLEKLRGLLAALPGDRAARLCQLAGRTDPTLGRVLDFCRGEPDVAVRRRFFAPLDPVSGEPGVAKPSRSYAPQALQSALWTWLDTELEPGFAARVRATVIETLESPGEEALDALRRTAADSIEAGVKRAGLDPRGEKRLKAQLDVSDFTSVDHVVSLLRCAPTIRTALAGLPTVIGEVSDALRVTLRDRYEAAVDADPDAAVWVLCLVMIRMERPWRLLRVFEKIARREDDLLVSQTDMGHVGEALLADAAFDLTRFAAPPATREAAVDAAEALAEFAAATVGMTREIGVRKDGPWGKRLFELRNRASEQMGAIHEAALDVVTRATPEAGAGKGRGGARDGENLPARAEALCLFLYLARDDASRAAVGGAHAKLMETLSDRLETCGARLLAGLREGLPGAHDAAAERAEAIAALMRALGETEAAGVLLRRTAAARAA